MSEMSPTQKKSLIGPDMQVLTDFKMPCKGNITAWRMYAAAPGHFIATVLEDLGSCSFGRVGINNITVPGPGYHVSRSLKSQKI